MLYNKLFLHLNGRHMKYHCTSPASIPVVGMCLNDSNSYGCLYNLIFFLVFHWEIEHSHVTKLQRFRRWSYSFFKIRTLLLLIAIGYKAELLEVTGLQYSVQSFWFVIKSSPLECFLTRKFKQTKPVLNNGMPFSLSMV